MATSTTGGAPSRRAVEVLAAADLVVREPDGSDGGPATALDATPDEVVAAVRGGASVALVTAGAPIRPGASAPVAAVVGAAVDAGLVVEVVPAPVAAVAALVASGLATDRIAVDPALPPAGPERRARLAELAGERRTTALPETADGLAVTLADLVAACGPDRPVAIAGPGAETTWRGPVADAVAWADAVVGAGPARAGAPVAGDALPANAARAGDALPADAARAGDAAPAGDVVVVVGGATVDPDAAEAATDDDIRSALRAARARGLAPGRAAAEVAAATGRSRREVYALGAEGDGA